MPSREQVAEVLAAHKEKFRDSITPGRCECGERYTDPVLGKAYREHLADALMPLFDLARNEALEEAAALILTNPSLQYTNSQRRVADEIRALKDGGA